MKKLVVVISLLTLCHCAAPKASSQTGIIVEHKAEVKNQPGVFKYYMRPANGRGRSFIIESTNQYAIGQVLQFNQTQTR